MLRGVSSCLCVHGHVFFHCWWCLSGTTPTLTMHSTPVPTPNHSNWDTSTGYRGQALVTPSRWGRSSTSPQTNISNFETPIANIHTYLQVWILKIKTHKSLKVIELHCEVMYMNSYGAFVDCCLKKTSCLCPKVLPQWNIAVVCSIKMICW